MSLFKRAPAPILTPDSRLDWASGAVFNPGADLAPDGTVRLLVRGVRGGYRRVETDGSDPYEPNFGYEGYVSALGVATRQPDGSFQLAERPFIEPSDGPDRYGCEDARVTRLGDRIYITYTALAEPAATATHGVGIGLASTTDWITLERHGRIGPAVRDKDATLFPGFVDGRIAMLHRIAPDIQLVFFEDEEQLRNPGEAFWEHQLRTLDDSVVLRPEQLWEGKKIGAGPPPIWTDEGWLLVYHGADSEHVYRAGLALLDLDDPSRVIARTKLPVLAPEHPFEREGDVPNVVFPQGAIVESDTDGQDMLHLYYGAADSAIGHAWAPMTDVLDLMNEEKGRWRPNRIHMDFAGHRDRRRTLGSTSSPLATRLNGGHPVLEPRAEHDWESRVVLNPAAVLVSDLDELHSLMDLWDLSPEDQSTLIDAGGACVMLYRAQGTAFERTLAHGAHFSSSIGLAVFTPDLQLVKRWQEPVLRPESPEHNIGVEDARCTKVGDTYYLHYTGYATTPVGGDGMDHGDLEGRVHLCLATTKDFLNWDLHGAITGDVNRVDDKNGALFPEPVDGKWLLWHRPMSGERAMAMHLAESDSPNGPWTARDVTVSSFRFRDIAHSWVGAAGPPVSLGDGRFLVVYHQGHVNLEGQRLYNLSAMLVEPSATQPILARLEPLLMPEGDLERVGDPLLGVDNVVFSCANYVWGGNLVVPYAGADSRIFGATFPLGELVARLEEIAAKPVGAPAF